jgi:hypothetical protein
VGRIVRCEVEVWGRHFGMDQITLTRVLIRKTSYCCNRDVVQVSSIHNTCLHPILG